MSSKKAKRASAAGSSSGSFPTRKVLFARDPDGPRRLAEYFASLVAEHMRSGADREQLSIGVEQFSLDSTHLEALENAGAIERDDNTFLAERGEVFRVPQAERDRCARMDEAVRSLEERLEVVWPTPADAEGLQPARRTSLRLRVSKVPHPGAPGVGRGQPPPDSARKKADKDEAEAAAYEAPLSEFMHDVPKGAARMTDVVRMLHADGLPQPSAVCLAIEELCGAACAAMEVERRFHWVEYILDCIDVQATQDRPLTVEAPLRAVCLGIADGSFGSDTNKQVSMLRLLLARGARLADKGTNGEDSYELLARPALKKLDIPSLEKNCSHHHDSVSIDERELAEARAALNTAKDAIDAEDGDCLTQ